MTSTLNELALFAGAGGGILAGKLLGWRTVCAVEIESYPASVLIARQNEGILEPFPIWDDVRTFDGKSWRGIVDVVSGGFPCQDISSAGKGVGITGERSGLWKQFARIIDEVRPRFAFVENSPVLKTKGLDTVLSDLAEMGYDAEWGVLGASDCGSPQKRKRLWILAHTHRYGLETDAHEGELCFPSYDERNLRHVSSVECTSIWPKPRPIGARLMGVDNGVAADVDRLKAVGNGQVPIVAATAFVELMKRLQETA